MKLSRVKCYYHLDFAPVVIYTTKDFYALNKYFHLLRYTQIPPPPPTHLASNSLMTQIFSLKVIIKELFCFDVGHCF